MTICPRTTEERHATAVEQRHVTCRPADDGMADLTAFLPADTAAAFMLALNAIAGAYASADERTADQRRADAVANLAGGVLAETTLPRRHGHRPAVQITVALSTVLGDDDQPGELAGFGAIPASLARRILRTRTVCGGASSSTRWVF